MIPVPAPVRVNPPPHPTPNRKETIPMFNFSRTLITAAAALALLAAPAAASAQDAHAGHAHGEAHGAETLKADLGTTTVAGVRVTVVQGNLAEAGGEVAFDLTTKGTAEPKAIRGWVGAADGKGALRNKAEKEKDGAWHLHVEAPKTLAPTDMLHIEVEPREGPRARIGFDIKRR